MTGTEEPMAVNGEVVYENGTWTLYLEFWYVEGIERKRFDTYRSEHKARVAARWIVWAARREINPPTGF